MSGKHLKSMEQSQLDRRNSRQFDRSYPHLIQNFPVNREARRRIKAAEKKTGIFFDF